MVNRVMGPTVRSGFGSLASFTSPLQPNHRPPFCFSASNTPAARPPAVASPSWIAATRLETTTRRDMNDTLSSKAVPCISSPAGADTIFVAIWHRRVVRPSSSRVKLQLPDQSSRGRASPANLHSEPALDPFANRIVTAGPGDHRLAGLRHASGYPCL